MSSIIRRSLQEQGRASLLMTCVSSRRMSSPTDSFTMETNDQSYRRFLGMGMAAVAYGSLAILGLFQWLADFLIPSWLAGWMRWVPTSPKHLEEAEKRVLSYLKRPYQSKFVELSSSKWLKEGNGKENVWTLILNNEEENGERLPLVLIHGFASGVALWSLNLDAFASHRSVFAFDLLGFGRSTRPTFSNAAHEAEHQLVQSVESWREAMKLDRFILLGHSMGGFLAASYALQHPHRVAHLILADPWGFPERPPTPAHHYQMPAWVKVVSAVLQPFNPLAGLRIAGPWGPRLVDRFRPDLKRKFETLVEDTDAISNYIYHCNAQTPSGESAFKSMTAHFGWAKHPMINRMNDLHKDVPITFIYGSRSWIDRQPGLQIKYMRANSYVDIQVIQGAGHHVYADRPQQFHQLVRNVCERVDSSTSSQSETAGQSRPPVSEDILQADTDTQREDTIDPEMF